VIFGYQPLALQKGPCAGVSAPAVHSLKILVKFTALKKKKKNQRKKESHGKNPSSSGV